MSAPASDKVTFTEEQSSSRKSRIVQGESGGSSSNDQPVAIADKHNGTLYVVIDNPENPQLHPCYEWLRSIEEEGGESSSNNAMPEHKIPKVPQMLRQMETESNMKFYDPQLVSIGPYHHKNAKLKSFEKIKIQFTREYVKSCKPTTSITKLYDEVAAVAVEARSCYAEGAPEGINETAFTQMMFLDGCFVLQYIHYVCKEDNEEPDNLKMKSHDVAFVRRDLFLLENQLPFKVLQVLMSMSSRFRGDRGMKLIDDFIKNTEASPPFQNSFQEMAENFITKHITDRKRKQQPESVESTSQPAHLLELMRKRLINPIASQTFTENKTVAQNNGGGGNNNNYYLWLMMKPIINNFFSTTVCKKRGGNPNYWYSYRSVQELKAAGIKFRPNKENIHFTEVRYEPLFIKAILRLPPMTIDDSTQSLLLNLVAYEMCPDTPNDYRVTSYIWFMDTLIDNAEDVKELRKKGILLNYLGSDEEVATLFNVIAKNLVPNHHAYEEVKNQIQRHYKNKVRLWMTEWLHIHFSTPWTFLAFLAAILAISLSFVQAYYAVNPKK